MKNKLIFRLVLLFALAGGVSILQAGIVIEGDSAFQANVKKELDLMRENKRGVVCRELMSRLDASLSTTTIRPVTSEEDTWHPNDRKGTRSFVTAVDTKIRGAERKTPTAAILYLHPNRVDPTLSLFRLGTLVYELALASDLNMGTFSQDFQVREKRAVFFRNAWCDALKFNVIDMSSRVATPEFKKAKAKGLLIEENASRFPILNPDADTFTP